jgi:hypothetical protein
MSDTRPVALIDPLPLRLAAGPEEKSGERPIPRSRRPVVREGGSVERPAVEKMGLS